MRPENRTHKDLMKLSPTQLIPMHCTAGPMKSQLGQLLTSKSRSSSLSSLLNIACSPDLKKRPADDLDSPNSPSENDSKKNKVGTNSPNQ